MSCNLSMEIYGHCDERFASLREEFERNFTQRGDVGASFAASVEGEVVVDIWGGHRDEAKTLPWEENTIVNVFSTTKTMTALCEQAEAYGAHHGSTTVRSKAVAPQYGQGFPLASISAWRSAVSPMRSGASQSESFS